MRIAIEIEALEKHPGWYRFELRKPGEFIERSPMTTLDAIKSSIEVALLQVEGEKQ